MELKARIEQDFKEALKKREVVAVSTLRMLKSALHNREIEKKGEIIQEAEIVKIIKKQVQQHHDSIEHFKKGKRDDLAEKEIKELQILSRYLPKQLTQEEIAGVIKRIIKETQAKDKNEFGRIMKLAMAELKEKADGKLVSQIVSTELKSQDPEKP